MGIDTSLPQHVEDEGKGFLRAALRTLFYVLVCVGVVSALAYGFLTVQPPRYSAHTTVLVEESGAERAVGPSAIEKRLRVLFSHEFARSAITELGLADRPEYGGKQGLLALLSGLLDRLGLSTRGGATVSDPALAEYIRNFTAFSIRDSRIIAIRFSAIDPQLAARGANAIAALFLDRLATEAAIEARVISSASAPQSPEYPKPVPTTVVVAAGVFILAMAVLLFRGMRRRSRTPHRRRHETSRIEPEMSVVSSVVEEQVTVARDPVGPQKEATGVSKSEIALWQSAIAAFADTLGGRSSQILVASVGASPAGERPPVGLALARMLTARERRVAFIDCYEDSFNLTSLGAEAPSPGLAELLVGEATFGETIHRDVKSRLHFISLGSGDAQALDDTAALDIALSALTMTYDCVVIDAPDQRIEQMGAHCAAALVATGFETPEPFTSGIVRRLASAGIAEERVVILPMNLVARAPRAADTNREDLAAVA